MKKLCGARPAAPTISTEGVTQLSTTVFSVPVQTFLEDAEARGAIDESALEAFALEHELEDDELTALRAELAVREVDLVLPAPDEPHVAPASTDSLTCSMRIASLSTSSTPWGWIEPGI